MTTVYNGFKERILDDIDLNSDTIRVALLSASQAYTPDVDNEVFVDDVIGATATESSGTGYSRKDMSLTITRDDAADTAYVTASTVTWSGLDTTNDVAAALVYKQVGGDDTTPGDDPLIAYVTSPSFPLTTDGSAFSLETPSDGLLVLSSAALSTLDNVDPLYDVVLTPDPLGASNYAVYVDGSLSNTYDDATVAVQAAFDATPAGGTLKLPETELTTTDGVTRSSSIEIFGGNIVHDHDQTGVASVVPAFDFDNSSTKGTTTTTEAIQVDVDSDPTVTVSSAANIDVGDLIIISDGTNFEGSNPQAETHKVLGIDTSGTDPELRLSGNPVFDVATAADVNIYDRMVVTWHDLTLTTDIDNDDAEYFAIHLDHVIDSELINPNISNFGQRSVMIEASYMTFVRGGRIERSRWSSLGYGVTVSDAARECGAIGTTINDCRHCTASGAGGSPEGVPVNVRFKNLVSRSNEISHCHDAHEDVFSAYWTDCDVQIASWFRAAFVSGAKYTYINGGNVWGGQTFETRAAVAGMEIYINGVEHYDARQGIHVHNKTGQTVDRVVIRNCHIVSRGGVGRGISLESDVVKCELEANTVDNFYYPVYLIGPDQVEIRGGKYDGAQRQVVNIQNATRGFIHGATFARPGIGTTNRDCISLTDSSKVLIQDCEIFEGSDGNMNDGVDESGTSDNNHVRYCVVEGASGVAFDTVGASSTETGTLSR